MSEGSLERLQGGVELAGNAEAYLSRATIAGSESVGIDVAGSSRVVLTDCRIAGTADAAVRISDTSDCLVEVHSTSLNPLDPEGDEIQIVDEDESEAHVVVDWLVGGVVRDPHGKSFENACAVFEGSDGSRRRVESGDDGLLEDSRLKEWEFRDGHRTEFNPYEVTVFGPDCLGEPIGSIPFPVDDDRVIPPFFRPPTQTGASCQADITINPDGNSGVGIAINVSQITLPPIQFDPDNHQAQVELTWCYEEGDVQTTLPPSISEGLDVWKFALGEAGQGEPGGADATSCSTSTNMDCISIVDGGVSCAGDSTRNSDSGSLAISLPGPTDANGDPIPGVMTYYVDAHARWELWDCTQTIKAKEASQSAQIVVQVTFANFVDEVEMLNPLSASPDDVDAGSVAGPGAVMDVYAGQEIPIIVDYQWSENGSTDDEQWFFYAYSGGWWLSPSANWTPCDFGSGGDDEVTIEDSWDWGANQNGDGQLEFTITAPGASDSSCIFETNGQQEAEITIYLTASCMTASPAGDYGAVTLYFRVHQP